MYSKMYNGKAIYNPSGKAGEYSYWACNFYVGCSNGCTYCYLKKGRGKAILGGDKPVLKKCFKDQWHALEIFEREMLKNKKELQEHGVFFSFTTDPLLTETYKLTLSAIEKCLEYDIPVKVLTKSDFTRLPEFNSQKIIEKKELVAFGFSLTGEDNLEPNAASNTRRIQLMRKCHLMGIKTFASIEPIVDFNSSFNMILLTYDYCNLYKIGLESGARYKKFDIENFIKALESLDSKPIYLKESITSKIDVSVLGNNFVDRDYNLFKSNG